MSGTLERSFEPTDVFWINKFTSDFSDYNK